MESSNDQAECILSGHLEFMRAYIEREEQRCKAALERFLAGKLSQRESIPRTSKVVLAGS
jgi:hypothetical protein